MKKYIMFFISIGLLLSTILIYSVINTEKSRESAFTESGYILDNLSERYYFLPEEKYKTANDKIEFLDTEGSKVSISNDNFVHYSSGNIVGLQDSVLLDLDKIDDDPITYYNVVANKELKKVGNRYTIKNLDTEIQLTKAISKISQSKYIILADKIGLKLNNGTTQEIEGYVEIEYSDNEIVSIYNQEISYQTISSESYIDLADNIRINLATKIVSKNNKNKMSLEDMVINSDDNVTLVDLNENKETENTQNEVKDQNTTENGTANENINNNKTTNNNSETTTINQGGSGDGSNSTIKTPDVKYDRLESNEQEIDVSKVLKEPVFKIKKMNVTSVGVSGTIEIIDTDDLLSKEDEIDLKIMSNSTGKITYKDTFKYTDIRDNKLMFNTSNLLPDITYTIVLSATYSAGDNIYTKNFIYKKFTTSKIGINIEKNGFTNSKMNFTVNVTDQSISEATVALLDVNGESVKQEYNEIAIDQSTKELSFEGLNSNTLYNLRIYNIKYNGATQTGEDWNLYTSYATLKQKAKIEASYSIDKRNNKFYLRTDNVIDEDKSIQSYTYIIYEAKRDGEELVYDENHNLKYERKVYTKETKDNEIEVAVKDNTEEENAIVRYQPYAFKIIANCEDNEKEVEVESKIYGPIMLAEKSYPNNLLFITENVTASEIKGTLQFFDVDGTVVINEDHPLEIKYDGTKSIKITNAEDTEKIKFNDNDSKYIIPIHLKDLKYNKQYDFILSLYVDLNDGEGPKEIYLNCSGAKTESVGGIDLDLINLGDYDGYAATGVKINEETSDKNALENLSYILFQLQNSPSYNINQSADAYGKWDKNSYETLLSKSRIYARFDYRIINDEQFHGWNEEIAVMVSAVDKDGNVIPVHKDNKCVATNHPKNTHEEQLKEIKDSNDNDVLTFCKTLPKTLGTNNVKGGIQITCEEVIKEENVENITIQFKIIEEYKHSQTTSKEIIDRYPTLIDKNNKSIWLNDGDVKKITSIYRKLFTDFGEKLENADIESSKKTLLKQGTLILDIDLKDEKNKAIYDKDTKRLKSFIIPIEEGTQKTLEERYIDSAKNNCLYKGTETGSGRIIDYDKKPDNVDFLSDKFKIIDDRHPGNMVRPNITSKYKIDGTTIKYELSGINSIRLAAIEGQKVYLVKDGEELKGHNDNNVKEADIKEEKNSDGKTIYTAEFTDLEEGNYSLKYRYIPNFVKGSMGFCRWSYADGFQPLASYGGNTIDRDDFETGSVKTNISNVTIGEAQGGETTSTQALNSASNVTASLLTQDVNKSDEIKIQYDGIDKKNYEKINNAKVTLTNSINSTSKILKIEQEDGKYISKTSIDEFDNVGNVVNQENTKVQVELLYNTENVNFKPKTGTYITYTNKNGKYLKLNDKGVTQTKQMQLYEFKNSIQDSKTETTTLFVNDLNNKIYSPLLNWNNSELKSGNTVIKQKELEAVPIKVNGSNTIKTKDIDIIKNIQIKEAVTKVNITAELTKTGNNIKYIAEICKLKNEQTNWKDILKTVEVNIDNQNKLNFEVDGLDPNEYYAIRFKYIGENGTEIYVYNTDLKTAEYKFGSIPNAEINNISINYEALKYNEKYINIKHNINPEILSQIKIIQYKIYSKQDNKCVYSSQDIEKYENNTIIKKININPENNVFKFDQDYYLEITPVVEIEGKEYTLKTTKKEFKLEALRQAEIGVKAIKDIENESLKLNINIKDLDSVIYGKDNDGYGEYTLQISRYTKNIRETIITEKLNLRDNAINYIEQLSGIDFSYNYEIKLIINSDINNNGTCREEVVTKQIIKDDTDISIGNTMIEKTENGIKLVFYNAENITKIDKFKYTIQGDSKNIENGQEDANWKQYTNADESYYYLEIPCKLEEKNNYIFKVQFLQDEYVVTETEDKF